ncbi:MAG TPA: helix-turn-helix domain-containing protein [Candidatus Paceibacterota bacterium]|nr:helix-turn-helix domain-containing protein [Candidatus Paceibacterota bacterium]
MHLRSVIEQLGYTPQEVTVYLASLELGPSSATEIAGKSRLPRTTVNLIIESLHRKGLMNAFIKRRRRIWAAENPERLLISVRENEAALKLILPELQSLRHDTGVKPTVRTYGGAEEIKQIMNDMLETKHHISAIISWDEWISVLGKNYVDDFIETRYRHFLRIRLLTPKTKLSSALKARDAEELRATQYLPASLEIKNTNFIYGNKVAIISLNTKRPVGILIEDQDIHHTMDVLFECLWRQSSGA